MLAGLQAVLERHLAGVADDGHRDDCDVIGIVADRPERMPAHDIKGGGAAGRIGFLP